MPKKSSLHDLQHDVVDYYRFLMVMKIQLQNELKEVKSRIKDFEIRYKMKG